MLNGLVVRHGSGMCDSGAYSMAQTQSCDLVPCQGVREISSSHVSMKKGRDEGASGLLLPNLPSENHSFLVCNMGFILDRSLKLQLRVGELLSDSLEAHSSDREALVPVCIVTRCGSLFDCHNISCSYPGLAVPSGGLYLPAHCHQAWQWNMGGGDMLCWSRTFKSNCLVLPLPLSSAVNAECFR